MNRSATLALAIVLAIALAGGGFVAGMTVASSRAEGPATASPAGRGGPGAAVRQGAGGQQGPLLNGQVLNVGEGTLTIQLGQEQGSRIVLVAPSTRVVRTTETDVSLRDLKPGDRVTVVGQQNADGTVNAQAVVVGGANVLQQFLGSPRPSPTR